MDALLHRWVLYAYYVFFGGLVTFYFAGGGHGSYLPFSILFSWGAVVCQVAGRLLPHSGWVFVAGPLVYLSLLAVVSSRTRGRALRWMLFVPASHAVGASVSIALLEGEKWFVSLAWLIGIPLVLAAALFALDFFLFPPLGRKGTAPANKQS